jgi:AAA15 family ATPase/GTPase
MIDTQNKPQSEIIIYRTEDGRTRIQVRLENETVWLTQKISIRPLTLIYGANSSGKSSILHSLF